MFIIFHQCSSYIIIFHKCSSYSIIFHHIPSYSIIFLVVGLRLLRLGAKTRRMQLWWFGKAKVIHFSAPMLTQNACGSFVLWSSWRRSMALSMGAAWRKGARALSLSLSPTTWSLVNLVNAHQCVKTGTHLNMYTGQLHVIHVTSTAISLNCQLSPSHQLP